MFRRRKDQLQVFLVHPGGPYWKNKDAGAWSLRALGIDTKKMFGTKSEVDPISHLIGTAVVWGGSSPSAAVLGRNHSDAE